MPIVIELPRRCEGIFTNLACHCWDPLMRTASLQRDPALTVIVWRILGMEGRRT
jgi:hypothetical protein